jgi:hypothetical protein
MLQDAPRSMIERPALCAVVTSPGEMANATSTPPDSTAWRVAVESPKGLKVIWSRWAAFAVSQ